MYFCLQSYIEIYYKIYQIFLEVNSTENMNKGIDGAMVNILKTDMDIFLC